MKNKYYLILTLLFLCSSLWGGCMQKETNVVATTHLRCNMQVDPYGIDTPQPDLSWEIVSEENDVYQEKYRILVASSMAQLDADTGDMWDSGWVDSGETIYIRYDGKNLTGNTSYFWKVSSVTNKGRTRWSNPARWTNALMNESDWKATWIGLDKHFDGDILQGNTRLSARYLRKEFNISGEMDRAVLHISGLGLYEPYINGHRIGNQVLAPAVTDYTKSVKYNSFDVTDQLTNGDNAIGVILGNGRFFTMRIPTFKNYGFPKLLLQLEIFYQDGNHETIVSDNSWKIIADGPIRSNNEFDGEVYDATKEMPGWNMSGFNESKWLSAEVVEKPEGKVSAQYNPNIEVMEIVKPISITQIKPDTYIMDMGQNMVGWVKMKVKGKRGDQVKLRFAELLKKDGTLYTDNLGGADATDIYTLKGENEEVWEPSFTYHGFRYVEISGYPGIPTVNDFAGKVIYDRMETTGTFETSNPTINAIHKNAYWGIRGNYRSFPTDCPQRQERLPWLGDRSTGCIGESFIFDNNLLYSKWIDDIAEAQRESGSLPDVVPNSYSNYSDNITWPSTYLYASQMLYNQYGNKKPIKEHYESMKKWLSYMEGRYMKDHIMLRDTYGDWCMPPEAKGLIHSLDPARKTNGELLATSFYYNLMKVMERFAGILEKPSEANEYVAKAEQVKAAFNDKFLNRVNGYYDNNTVTANLLPLSFGMVPKEYADKVFDNIVEKTMIDFNGHVSTGVIGIQKLMRGLTNFGRPDIAWKLATNTDYPSWGYMIESGATTIWELWNGDTADPSMNSANHVMLLGDLIIWYYEYLAGIQTDKSEVGFKKIIMKPHPIDGLDYVKASYKSVRGEIKSHWIKKNGNFEWDITIPANTSATVYVPGKPEKVVEVSSGSHKFIGTYY